MKMKDNYLIPVIPFEGNIISYGKGSYVYDAEGNKYLDINSGQFCSVFGHSNQDVAEYMFHNILNKIQHTCTSMLSEDVILAAKKINEISGEMNAYSIFLSTGAEAVEFCLRYAKHITGKSGIICFDKGYHGLSLGTQSVTYKGIYTNPHVPYTYSVKIPDTFANEQTILDCIEEVKNIVVNNRNEIAAMLFEPIVSVGGMVIPNKLYFEKIREICSDNKILLIFDECQTGFGRTGSWFYYQRLGCIPDMVATAKGIGLGFPVSLVMLKKEFIPDDGFTMTHYSSHQNDPFAAGIIKFSIDYIIKNNILQNIVHKGDYFIEKLVQLAEDTSIIVKPRGKGLMIGVDLYFKNLIDYRKTTDQFIEKAYEYGLIMQSTDAGRTLRFLPSYLIDYNDIDYCVKILYKLCKEFEYLNK